MSRFSTDPSPDPSIDGFNKALETHAELAGVMVDEMSISPADVITSMLATALSMAEEFSRTPIPVMALHEILDELNKKRTESN